MRARWRSCYFVGYFLVYNLDTFPGGHMVFVPNSLGCFSHSQGWHITQVRIILSMLEFSFFFASTPPSFPSPEILKPWTFSWPRRTSSSWATTAWQRSWTRSFQWRSLWVEIPIRYHLVCIVLTRVACSSSVHPVCGNPVLHVTWIVSGSKVQLQIRHLGHGLCDFWSLNS